MLNESTVEDYIRRSKLTGQGRNGIAYSEEFWDYLASHKDLTIFWNFLHSDIYFDKNGLSKYSRIGMIVLNIYHFFIKKRALFPCLNNLKDFLYL